MPAIARRWTAAEVRRLIEEGEEFGPRYELIDGELLVTPAPAPRHQIALAWLHGHLAPYVQREALGTTLWSPADLELTKEQLTQPDLFVVPQLPGESLRAWRQVTHLLLVVEVLSPSTARNDRERKRPHYQQVGVPECWLVDLDAHHVERWCPDDEAPNVSRSALRWNPVGTTAALTIDLEDLWRVTAAS